VNEVHLATLFGERSHAGVALQGGCVLVAAAIVAKDGEELADFEEAGVSAEGGGFLDEFETFLDDFGTTAALLAVELGDGAGAGFLDGLEGGPFGEQGDGERSEEVTPDELEGLGVVVFEGLGEFVGEAGANVDELASLLNEGGDLVGERVGGGAGF